MANTDWTRIIGPVPLAIRENVVGVHCTGKVQYQYQSGFLRQFCKAASFTAFFIVAGTASVMALYVGTHFPQLMSPIGTCLTSYCFQLAEKTAALLDTTIGPCDNFYRFACGRATNSATVHTDLYIKDVIHKVQRLLATWALEEDLQTPLQESASLYQRCLTVSNDANTGIRDLVELVKKRKIDATNQDSFTDPLDAVLTLEIRDNIKTIFDIVVDRGYMVVRRRENLEPWFEMRKKLIQRHVFRDYLENAFRLMGTKSKNRMNMLVTSVRRSEDQVLSLSSKTAKGHDGRSHALVFLSSANESAVLKRREWKNNLLKYWNKLSIDGANLVAYLDHLFDALKLPDIIYYIYWEVIRQLGPFADFRFRAPDEQDDKATADHCFRAILHLAGVPSVAMIIAQDVTSEHIISASSFVTDLVRKAGLNASISIVNPREVLRQYAFMEKPPVLNHAGVPFLRVYLKSLVASRQIQLGSMELVKSRIPGLKDLLGRHVSFDREELSVPTSLVRSSLFCTESPRSFNYAGLGYEVMLGLAASGALNGTSRHGCQTSEVPEQKVRALDALWNLFDGDGRNLGRHWLPGSLQAMTAGHLLFVGFCQNMCTTKDANACNVPLRSMPEFARTFKCQRGSYMRPIGIGTCGTRSGSH